MYYTKSIAAAANNRKKDAQLFYIVVFASSRFVANIGASRIYSAKSGRTFFHRTLSVMVEVGLQKRYQGRHFCGAKTPSERTSKKHIDRLA